MCYTSENGGEFHEVFSLSLRRTGGNFPACRKVTKGRVKGEQSSLRDRYLLFPLDNPQSCQKAFFLRSTKVVPIDGQSCGAGCYNKMILLNRELLAYTGGMLGVLNLSLL